MSARRRGTGPGPNTTRRLRRRLLTARRALFVEIQDVEHDLLVLEQEPRSELEERSQGEASARLLTRLEDREQAELREIEDALARIDAGTYGSCASCGRAIPVARLEAVPAATLCLTCEEAHETAARTRVEGARERIRCGIRRSAGAARPRRPRDRRARPGTLRDGGRCGSARHPREIAQRGGHAAR